MKKQRTTTSVKSLWRLLGFGYYQAWVYVAVLSTVLFPDAALFPEQVQITRPLFSGSLVVGMLAIMLISRSSDFLSKRKGLLYFVGCLVFGGTLFVAVPAFPGFPAITNVLIGIALTGVGNAVLVIAWGEFWTKIDPGRMATHLVISNVFACALYLVIISLPGALALFLTACLPLASIITLLNMSDEPKREGSGGSTDTSKRMLAKAICVIAIIPLAFGVSRAFSSPQDPFEFQALQTQILFGVFAFSILVAILVLTAKGERSLVRLYRLVVPLMLVGFITLPFIPKEYQWVSFAAIMCGHFSFEELVWLLKPEFVFKFRFSTVHVFGFGRLLFHGFGFLGSTLGFFILNSEWWGSSALLATCGIFAVVLVVVSTFIFTEHDLYTLIKQPQKATAASMNPDEAVTQLAEKYALSARETEVFSLLAKGRNVPFIGEELFISKSTVKTHTIHIYEKLGVKTRQELINLVESFD